MRTVSPTSQSFQFAPHKTHHPSLGAIFAGRNNCQANRCAWCAPKQRNCLSELPALKMNWRFFVLSDGYNLVTHTHAFLNGRGRVRQDALYNDVFSFHAQNDADSRSFGIWNFGGTGCDP
jgi:hypothetical protein